MYPSDYGYSVSDSNCDDSMANWYQIISIDPWEETNKCFSSSWIYKEYYNQWTITGDPNDNSKAYTAHANGHIAQMTTSQAENATTGKNYVRPAIYLKSTVKIISGTGQRTDPYILSL